MNEKISRLRRQVRKIEEKTRTYLLLVFSLFILGISRVFLWRGRKLIFVTLWRKRKTVRINSFFIFINSFYFYTNRFNKLHSLFSWRKRVENHKEKGNCSRHSLKILLLLWWILLDVLLSKSSWFTIRTKRTRESCLRKAGGGSGRAIKVPFTAFYITSSQSCQLPSSVLWLKADAFTPTGLGSCREAVVISSETVRTWSRLFLGEVASEHTASSSRTRFLATSWDS